jgi:hypothetical protein
MLDNVIELCSTKKQEPPEAASRKGLQRKARSTPAGRRCAQRPFFVIGENTTPLPEGRHFMRVAWVELRLMNKLRAFAAI